MQNHRAASRYAKSLLGLAKEQGVLEEIHSDMLLFTSVARENRIFAIMLKNPIITHDKKKNILHALFEKRMHPMTLLIFDLITSKNREGLLEEIAKDFVVQYNALKGLQTAEVATTFALDASLRSRIEAMVKEISGKEAILKETIDEDLVGGFVLNIGDLRLDRSLKSQLTNIKKELTK